MSWFDRINAALVRRITGRMAIVADEQGLEQAGQRVAYADLQHAVAYRHPSYVGDDLAVVLDFGKAWKPLLAALDVHPRIQRSSPEWRVMLVAGAPEVRIELLSPD
jgi:hypothetical protein